jgi:hypothetical protein
MPSHDYVFLPNREPWPASAVNARVPAVPVGDKLLAASTWLDRHRPVEQATWALPPDDRRSYVAWSDATPADFAEDHWIRFYRWLDNGGAEIVAGFLHDVDLTGFNPKAPPPKTDAFWEIVNAGEAPEKSEMADALEKCGWPDVVTIGQLKNLASADFADWLADRKNARRIPHRLEDCGYVVVQNPDADDGRWRIGEKQRVYGNKRLSKEARLQAAADLTEGRL